MQGQNGVRCAGEAALGLSPQQTRQLAGRALRTQVLAMRPGTRAWPLIFFNRRDAGTSRHCATAGWLPPGLSAAAICSHRARDDPGISPRSQRKNAAKKTLQNVVEPATELALQADLDWTRLRTHAAATRGGALAVAVPGMAVVWALDSVVVPTHWIAWVIAMAGASGLREALTRGWRGLPANTLPTARWLWRFRAGLALQGLVCGAVAWLPASVQDPQTQWILRVGMISTTGSAMVLTQFDIRAGLMFVVPALLPLGLRLLALNLETAVDRFSPLDRPHGFWLLCPRPHSPPG